MHFSDNPRAPKINWKNSAWLGAYLLGMGIISWQGQFGPENSGRLPFWWDLGVVAVFSVVIYFWALSSCNTRSEMEDAIVAQAGGAEDWEAHLAGGAGEIPAA
jgi:hypothetical protein